LKLHYNKLAKFFSSLIYFLVGWQSETSSSSAGSMGFEFRVDQVSHILPTTRHHCNFEVWTLSQSRGDGHR